MALSDLQTQSNLYLAWQNTLSAIENAKVAAKFVQEQISSVKNTPEFSTYVTDDELQYLTNVSTLVTEFINDLPEHPT
ncbi:hypothetical protein EBZ39_15090 [bacterium]|nr:hypothetical protein [bacterium]